MKKAKSGNGHGNAGDVEESREVIGRAASLLRADNDAREVRMVAMEFVDDLAGCVPPDWAREWFGDVALRMVARGWSKQR